MITPEKLLRAGMRLVTAPVLPTGSVPIGGSASANNSAILNNTISNVATKVIAAHPAFGPRVRLVRLVIPPTSVNVAYCLTQAGASAPTLTAAGDGTSTDGTVIAGSAATQVIEFSMVDRLDMWLVCNSTTDTPAYQITMTEL